MNKQIHPFSYQQMDPPKCYACRISPLRSIQVTPYLANKAYTLHTHCLGVNCGKLLSPHPTLTATTPSRLVSSLPLLRPR